MIDDRSDSAMEPPSPEEPQHPQRLSALYQYHNAPEVAPAHGLEYDDSNYPHSDKYPVIHTAPAYTKWSGKHGLADDSKPPRIIFGMEVRTFLFVATIMIMVIVGAAVGGAVGGSTIRYSSSTATAVVNATSSATTSIAVATPSSYSAPTPTFTPISDCPKANNTVYTSTFSSGSAGTVSANTRLNFTRYCDIGSPLTNANTLSSSFVYSFEDCIEVCAAINFYGSNANCTVAAFQETASRPSNCWVGSVIGTTFSNLTTNSGIDVALLST